MRFDPSDLKKRARDDFYSEWERSSELFAHLPPHKRYPYISRNYAYGSVHPVFDTVQILRNAFLRMGFDETSNPLIVDEADVYRQFGPEAPAVLDRVFYLAGLPRADIGLSDDTIGELKRYVPHLNEGHIEALKNVFRAYKKGGIEGDDLVSALSDALSVTDTVASQILDEVFSELKELIPQPSRRTLRSHMTSGWFITLSNLAKQ
ncbi:MAG: tRNA ligase subunit PheS family protein, partial [Methermicoccaceae archaeon]